MFFITLVLNMVNPVTTEYDVAAYGWWFNGTDAVIAHVDVKVYGEKVLTGEFNYFPWTDYYLGVSYPGGRFGMHW